MRDNSFNENKTAWSNAHNSVEKLLDNHGFTGIGYTRWANIVYLFDTPDKTDYKLNFKTKQITKAK